MPRQGWGGVVAVVGWWGGGWGVGPGPPHQYTQVACHRPNHQHLLFSKLHSKGRPHPHPHPHPTSSQLRAPALPNTSLQLRGGGGLGLA